MIDYAMQFAICQFARVFHVRDFICAYAKCILSLSAFLKAFWARFRAHEGRVKGRTTLMPSRHEGARGSGRGGQLWGALTSPPSSTNHRESVANGASPLSGCTSSRNVCVSCACARIARYRRKKEFKVQYGHSIYLIITVPIDTTLIINNLQNLKIHLVVSDNAILLKGCVS